MENVDEPDENAGKKGAGGTARESSEGYQEDSQSGEQSGSSEKAWWSDTVRDFASAGIATLFMTEDSIRSYLREKKLPKEMVTDFLDSIGRRKNDFYSSISSEFGKVLSRLDLGRELKIFLEQHTIHFEGKVRFERKENE